MLSGDLLWWTTSSEKMKKLRSRRSGGVGRLRLMEAIGLVLKKTLNVSGGQMAAGGGSTCAFILFAKLPVAVSA